jgi:hypothetical protein
MKLAELIAIASGAYDDDLVAQYYEDRNGKHGDGLARFIAEEIEETFESDAPTEQQLTEAIRVITSARDQLDAVVAALEAAC